MNSSLDDGIRRNFCSDLTALGFERLSTADGHDILEGTITVPWVEPTTGAAQLSEHRITVILAPAFPFQKPAVFPRDNPPVSRQRHQAPREKGALCLWTDDDDGWFPARPASALLERVCLWFAHYHQGDWPASDRPPDLQLYFPTASTAMMLIGESWDLPDDATEGRFRLRRGAGVPHRALAEAPGVGAAVTDQAILAAFGFDDEDTVTVGLWFRLTREPWPQANLAAMLDEIDDARGTTRGSARFALISLFGRKVEPKHGRAAIALGYPDPAGEELWLFLDIDLTEGVSGTSRVKWSGGGALERVPVRAFTTASVAPEALMRRAGPRARQLDAKSVLIFGVGSVGGSVALQLAKSGVPKLRLVDGDVLRPGNAVRHVAGHLAVGWSKASAVRFAIAQHAPSCEVETADTTWDLPRLSEWIAEADLVVDATANESFSLLLNELCTRSDTPALYVATFRRATVGHVHVVASEADACLVCRVFGYRLDAEDPPYPSVPAGDEGAFVEDGCGVPTIEAPASDIEASANVAARAALRLLTQEAVAGNLCVVVNDVLPGYEGQLAQEGIHWSSWSPIAGCDVCGRGGGVA